MTELFHKTVPSPIGRLRLVATGSALVAVDLPKAAGAKPLEAQGVRRHPVLDAAAEELAEYFRGVRRLFLTPLAPAGTPFQRAVWDEVALVPFGEVRSYAEVALEIGRPRAVRAVGGANARNPVPIFVPCHRVIGSNGSLTGYAGGLDAKRWLLSLEGSRGA
jgi:methylated-DNA-[protein]-cysteine S-methyltransferase